MSRKTDGIRDKRHAIDVDATEEPSRSTAHGVDALRKQLADIVRGVSVEDEQALEHARQRIVKAVLLWEFGQELRENTEWIPMVETISNSLAVDHRFVSAFNNLIKEFQV